jgi:hypothetical protein
VIQSAQRKPLFIFIIFYILLLTIIIIMFAVLSLTPSPQPTASLDVITVLVIPLISLIFGFSGWIAFLYDYYSSRPKIRGKILNVMRGQFDNPQKPSEKLTVFILFLYLTNLRKSAIHLSNFDLEVDVGKGFEKTQPIRGFGNTNVHFAWSTGGEVQIPDFNKGLIYKQKKPIEFGVPFYGYLAFGADSKFYKAEINCYKIICTDIFDHKHVTKAKPEKFVDLFYLQETFNIKIPLERQSINPPETTQTTTNLISDNDVTT